MGDLSMLWSARSVAIVGASDRPGALGRLPVEYLLRYGYPGRILPVNPGTATVCGMPAYPSVAAAPGPVDLALILVGAERAPAAVDDCVAAGVPVAIVGSSGFAETGDDGRKLQEDLVRRAGAMRLVGPNCIGAVGFHTGLVASFSPLFGGEHTAFVPGTTAFVSQSGALGYGAVSLALERGLGLGWAVTTGNEADVTALEVMTALAGEPDCTAVLGYVEHVGPGLRDLARRGKPTALLVAGRSAAGAKAAVSHTGALATDDRVVDAALRQLGIVRVADVDELLDVGDAFAQPRRPAGPRVAIVTTSGGSGILAADAVADHRLNLAEFAQTTLDALRAVVPAYGAVGNPVDVTATVMRDRTLVARCLDAVATDPSVDAIVVCFCVLTGDDVAAIVDALRTVAEATGKPVLVARTGADHLAPTAAAALRAAGIPAYPTPARAVRALAALWQVSRPRPAIVEPGSPDVRTPESAEPGLRVGDEAGAKAALARAGIRVPRGRYATGPDDAAAAVREVGGRAVFKAAVPGLTHKTEVGGVVLDVDGTLAGDTWDRLAHLGGRVLVEEQVPRGLELLVGIAPTPLGRVLTIGAGGVLTEVLDDVAIRLLPVAPAEIGEMLAELRVSHLLAGYRGRPAADVAAVREIVERLVALAADLPDDVAVDLNPVVALPDGAIVLDAAVVRDTGSGRGTSDGQGAPGGAPTGTRETGENAQWT